MSMALRILLITILIKKIYMVYDRLTTRYVTVPFQLIELELLEQFSFF